MITYTSWKTIAPNRRIRYYTYTTPASYFVGFGHVGKSYVTYVSDSGDVSDFEANFKPGAMAVLSESEVTELSEFDAVIGTADGRLQRAFEFGTTTIYMGYADIGVAQSATGWTIKKLTLDGSGNPTSEKWTAVGTATWNNRASETYS